MSASKPTHWQQPRSSRLPHDSRSVAFQPPWSASGPRSAQHDPAHATENAWLYGAGASAVVFIAMWYWQGLLGFPDLSADIVRPSSHNAMPVIPRVGRMRPHHAASDASAPAAAHAPRTTRALPAAARRAPTPQPAAESAETLSALEEQPEVPDMDLMDAPSSPLEQLALYSVRARQTANATEAYVDPPHEVPGTLRINSRPWAHVFIDGQAVGNTPLRALSIRAGQHTVRLTNPDFGMAKSFNLHVEAGESITRIESLDD